MALQGRSKDCWPLLVFGVLFFFVILIVYALIEDIKGLWVRNPVLEMTKVYNDNCLIKE